MNKIYEFLKCFDGINFHPPLSLSLSFPSNQICKFSTNANTFGVPSVFNAITSINLSLVQIAILLIISKLCGVWIESVVL